MHPFRSAGVVGTARKEGDTGNRGRPVAGEGSGLNVLGRALDAREAQWPEAVAAIRLLALKVLGILNLNRPYCSGHVPRLRWRWPG